MGRRVQFDRAKPRKKATPSSAIKLCIDNLSHDGRGIGRLNGKTIFVADALPNEEVEATVIKQHRRFDEAQLAKLHKPSSDRTEPECKHYQQCGGCQLQHLAHDQQIIHKQSIVLEQLKRTSQLIPDCVQPPLASAPWHYRRSARIGINQRKDGSAVVGFRRKNSNRIEAINDCKVLAPAANALLPALTSVLDQQPGFAKIITHAQVTLGDNSAILALRVKGAILAPLLDQLTELCQQHKFNLCLITDSGPQIAYKHTNSHFDLEKYDLSLNFEAGDFIQVNAQLNQQMIERALEWLAPKSNENILDLFCGLGNFSLPIARFAGSVVGVEGSEDMVNRAHNNAKNNALENCSFHCADLSQSLQDRDWFNQSYDKIIVDPPRTGAFEVIQQLCETDIKQILYVSCNPASLARDGALMKAAGFNLSKFCVMDMFPQTTHVESLALFTRG